MSPQPLRTDNLALAFQELITVGERLRSNRQTVSDAPSFRAQIWAAVKSASDQARNRGYPQEDIELATFAVIAFVDESILNLRHPIFADWPRQPLQEERYGHHVAGEIFFQNLQKLLVRNDSTQLADLLEVYYLCLMLGFAGRYSMGGRGELRAIMQQTGDKLQRIRQTSAVLSPDCQPPADQVRQVSGDPVARALLWVAIGCAVLMIALFIIFRVMLGGGIEKLQTASAGTAVRPQMQEGTRATRGSLADEGVRPTKRRPDFADRRYSKAALCAANGRYAAWQTTKSDGLPHGTGQGPTPTAEDIAL